MKSNKLPQPGDIVKCVIGQHHEVTWAPAAPVLLLTTEASFHTTRFFGMAKKPSGDLIVLFHVAERPDGIIADDRGWGEYYSALSLNYTNGELAKTELSRYLPMIEEAMTYHATAIKNLPVYTEIAGSYKS